MGAGGARLGGLRSGAFSTQVSHACATYGLLPAGQARGHGVLYALPGLEGAAVACIRADPTRLSCLP